MRPPCMLAHDHLSPGGYASVAALGCLEATLYLGQEEMAGDNSTLPVFIGRARLSRNHMSLHVH